MRRLSKLLLILSLVIALPAFAQVSGPTTRTPRLTVDPGNFKVVSGSSEMDNVHVFGNLTVDGTCTGCGGGGGGGGTTVYTGWIFGAPVTACTLDSATMPDGWTLSGTGDGVCVIQSNLVGEDDPVFHSCHMVVTRMVSPGFITITNWDVAPDWSWEVTLLEPDGTTPTANPNVVFSFKVSCMDTPLEDD